MPMIADWTTEATLDWLENQVCSGLAIRLVYPLSDRLCEASAAEVCRILGGIYSACGIGPVRVTFQEVGPLMVVVMDPTNGSGPLFGKSLLGLLFERWMGRSMFPHH